MTNPTDNDFDPSRRSPARRPPPRWRSPGSRLGTRRDPRPADRWGPGREPYPGATVLLDLDDVARDPAAASAIVARFAAVQIMLLVDAGVLTGTELEAEIQTARTYLEELETFRPGERDALGEILEALPGLSESRSTPALATALISAGDAARDWGHPAGARACYLAASHFARREGWHAEEASADAALANLQANLSPNLSPRRPPQPPGQG